MRMERRIAVCGLGFLVLVTFLVACAPGAPASPPPQTPVPSAVPGVPVGAPVTLNGKTLFTVRARVGSILPAERAAAISRRLTSLATNPFLSDVTLSIVESEEGTDIVAGSQIVMTLTDDDAAAENKPRQQLASERAAVIQRALAAARAEYSARALFLDVLYAVLATAAFIALWIVIGRVYRRLRGGVERGKVWLAEWGPLERSYLYRSGQLHRFLLAVLRVVYRLAQLALIILYVLLLLSLLPWTRALVVNLISDVLTPLAALWQSFVEYVPSLFFIVVIALAAWVLIRIARLFFTEIEKQTIRIPSFDPEWASFTFNIVAFFIILFAVIVAFPYLPGSGTPAFQGIAVFLGLVVSLSSSSAISNVIAGVILTYTGAFRVGDVVQIGNVTGMVLTKSLLVTRVRTFKNEQVSIPNSLTLNTHVTNYTAMAKSGGLILHTTVTIGYSAPWKQVHDLLVAAARATEGILADPPPFVLQTSLNDFHISYELNCYSASPEFLPRLYSALHQNIQEKFNEAGVEIMSPKYSALRDGNQVTIPENYLPKGYRAPGFRVENNK